MEQPREKDTAVFDLQLRDRPKGSGFKTVRLWTVTYNQLLKFKARMEQKEVRNISMAEFIDALVGGLNLG